METSMEVHQTEFLQAVALAGIVALAMTVWDTRPQAARAQIAGTPARTVVMQTGVNGSYIVAATRRGKVQP
jgi:hypothetical protein